MCTVCSVHMCSIYMYARNTHIFNCVCTHTQSRYIYILKTRRREEEKNFVVELRNSMRQEVPALLRLLAKYVTIRKAESVRLFKILH